MKAGEITKVALMLFPVAEGLSMGFFKMKRKKAGGGVGQRMMQAMDKIMRMVSTPVIMLMIFIAHIFIH